jgi:apolipoprotein D and lipocalin family protein
MVILLLLSLASAASAAAPATRMTPVATVDLERYAGRWYEIAKYPNRFQRDCAGDTSAEYALRPDGRVTVTNRCRQRDGRVKEAVGVARWRENPPRDATLKVRFAPEWLSFIPQVWGDYWILALPDDYRYVVIGEPSRKYLWILSRTPAMTETDFMAAVVAAEAQGYDASKLVRTPQRSG